MITEIVTFALPDGMSRDEALALYEATAAGWQANPDLVRKYYLFDGESQTGGGVYLWPSIDHAQAAHNDAWCDKAEALYGSRPTFRYFETPLIVDNSG